MFGKQLRQAETEGVCLVAVDCGAGVGRVSEQLLLHVFQEVDLIEPSAHLLCTATERLTGPGRKCVGFGAPLRMNLRGRACLDWHSCVFIVA